ncbi:unnamed protein product [Rotaria magnacalcarata]|nr:unnamed protein product [Rotaria magnacalcarata]CAF1605057.1 unnamed protein product [Rotaria magnacalcarata]CAF1936440.1 unnamed protein product [Rotaria magnacalcarata]
MPHLRQFNYHFHSILKDASHIKILQSFLKQQEPFETILFERMSRALPRLRTLEIIDQFEQQENSVSLMKTNIDFPHLAVLILYYIHIDYVKQLICQINLLSLIEFGIKKDILFTIISQNQQQARDNCSKVEILRTSKPSYESIYTIRNFSPLAYYVKHEEERAII